MKKILVAVFVIIMALSACTNANTSRNEETQKTAISVGHSIQNLGLDLSEQNTDVVLKEGKYSDDVKINGKYTNVSTKSSDGSLEEAYLQGFYKSDLENGKIYINGKTVDQKDLVDKVVYETNDFIVFDITSYIQGEDSQIEVSLDVKSKQAPAKPSVPQKAIEASANL